MITMITLVTWSRKSVSLRMPGRSEAAPGSSRLKPWLSMITCLCCTLYRYLSEPASAFSTAKTKQCQSRTYLLPELKQHVSKTNEENTSKHSEKDTRNKASGFVSGTQKWNSPGYVKSSDTGPRDSKPFLRHQIRYCHYRILWLSKAMYLEITQRTELNEGHWWEENNWSLFTSYVKSTHCKAPAN